MFKKMIKYGVSVILIVLILNTRNLSAQTLKDEGSESSWGKNNIGLSLGFVPLYFSYGISYERLIFESVKPPFSSYWIKGSYGGWGAWSVGGPLGTLTLGALTGKGKHHLEVNAGVCVLYDRMQFESEQEAAELFNEPTPTRGDYIDTRLAGGIGYRFQTVESDVSFSVGISFPESAYIRLGFCF